MLWYEEIRRLSDCQMKIPSDRRGKQQRPPGPTGGLAEA
jgi:hypothetical protein